jgi:hypothetical protein
VGLFRRDINGLSHEPLYKKRCTLFQCREPFPCNSLGSTASSSLNEPGSSVSTVSGYKLDDRVIEVRFPAEATSLCVQTGSEAHPASCTMGTGGSFPGCKARPGRDADHSPPSSAEVENQ